MSPIEKAESNTYPMERVEFLCDKSLFKGKVYRPADLENCKGIVIFTHGLGYCDRQYDIDGQYFADNNYLMLTYNLRGHAGTPGKWSLQNSVDDLIEGINFLVRRYNFPNKERICVIGHSTGALITLLASLKDPRIKFGSVVTTVTSLKDSYSHWFKSGFNKEVKEFFKSKGIIPPIIESFLDQNMLGAYCCGEIPVEQLEMPHRYGLLKCDSFNQFFHEIGYSENILDCADRLTLPLLLFRGEYDEVMDVQKTNELYERLDKKIPSKLYITNSKNHFHNDKWDLIQSETLKFFDAFCAIKEKREPIGDKKILIVDDEIIVTKTLNTLLKKQGFGRVTIANSGEDALQKIAKLQKEEGKYFDMIITDIRMPGLDGIETIKKVKEMMGSKSKKGSSVIFMTGYEGDKTQEDARALGYVDYLYKPFDLEEFIASVRKHLEP